MELCHQVFFKQEKLILIVTNFVFVLPKIDFYILLNSFH